MSVQYVQGGGSGILGTLGTLASLGGTMFGVPMLTTLGTGMTGIDTLMNGGGDANTIDKTGGALHDLIATLWKKPTDGNIASKAGTIADAAKKVGQREGWFDGIDKGWWTR